MPADNCVFVKGSLSRVTFRAWRWCQWCAVRSYDFWWQLWL